VSLRGGYSRAELEAFGAGLVEVLAYLLAGVDGDAAAVRARVLEVVTVEEAGRVAAAKLEERVAPLVLSAAQLSYARGDRDTEGVRETVRRWFDGQDPTFVVPLVAAVEELAASWIAGAG